MSLLYAVGYVHGRADLLEKLIEAIIKDAAKTILRIGL